MLIDNEKMIWMYRTMVRHREFEDRVLKHFSQGDIPGFVHLSQGEEAIPAGAMAALRDDDYILTHHRAHGHLVAKGGDVARMMAELFGRKTGIMKGKGGSMHLTDPDVGDLGADGIVATGLVTACGAGLSSKMRNAKQVTVCFFGDGCLNTARFHEGLNLAAIWKLPVVYVCENNGYAEETPITYSMSSRDAIARASSYDIPAVTVDGNDVIAVYEAVAEAVNLARGGQGPSFIECNTCRWRGHFEGDPQETYRTKKEMEECKKKDPILRFKIKLLEIQVLTEGEIDRIYQEAVSEMDKAVEFAMGSPWPEPDEVLSDVYAETPTADEGGSYTGPMREVTFLKAINEAIDEELTRDSGAFLMGEDIQKWGASLGEFKGLCDKHGPERVRNTPISETAIMGTAIGAAATGMRPIAFMMFGEFMGVCMSEILNALCKSRYMTGGKVKMPVTIMAYSGAGMSAAGEHSSCLDGLFSSITGLKLVAPSTSYDAKGLLKSAIRDNNPVVFFYHKMLLSGGYKSHIPNYDYTIPLGKADIKRVGSDITIVAWALMVHRALAAAKKLEERGINVEVVDPRTLVPLDMVTIAESVKKTGRLVIIDEEPKTGSFSADIIATVSEELFDYLKAPVKRVCAPDTPIPFSPVLEKIWMPDEQDLINAVMEIM
jgi:pyruvate/2-oxoglutarate/acetoin dehydrogenase E1 component/TPP-dependent pyruvate/acetoin dehydrogenase alpha subunit